MFNTFNVGDIVKWGQPDTDDVEELGVILYKKPNEKLYTVFWFEDGSSNDYLYYDLKLVQKV